MASKLPSWTEGIKKTLEKYHASMPELYSWHAVAEDGAIIFITEADHSNKNSSIVKLKEGYIQRNIDAASKDWGQSSIRHAKDVFNSAKHAYENDLPVKVLLTRNSRYSQTPEKITKAMLLPWDYKVTVFSGESVEKGFSYRLEQL